MARVLGGMLVVSTVLMAACYSAPYQRLARGGGYLEQRIEEDEYLVTYRAYADLAVVYDYAILRAADIGRRLGFTHFVVLGGNDISVTRVLEGSSTTTTEGTVTSDGRYIETTKTDPGTFTSTNPGIELHVKYFDGVPEGRYVEVYEVARTLDEIARRRGVELAPAQPQAAGGAE